MIPLPAIVEPLEPLQAGVTQDLFANATITSATASSCSALTSGTVLEVSNVVYLSDPAREQACRKIEELAKLELNWDFCGGVAPAAQAISEAKRFIRRLPAHVRMPEIEPSGDGEINLVWRSSDRYLEVGGHGEGAMSFFAKSRLNPAESEFGDFALPEGVPPVLLDHLSRFTNAPVRL